MPVAVKICGINRVEDAVEAARAGVHALGFVFHPSSPRHIDIRHAQAIVCALPPFITTVGVFVDPQRSFVAAVLEEIRLGVLQFHGDEDPAFCANFGLPYIKAVRVREDLDLLQYAGRFRGAQALLLDTFVPGKHGGTGQTFDWTLIPSTLQLPVVLSGGLDAMNVASAIRNVRPWAVDVSSGVESGKGIKDAAKIAAFMQGVRDANL
jgi:phosphoribosylanthranilate isomerase